MAGREIGVAAVVAASATRAGCSRRCKAGRTDLHFIEVMTCPGGCINGGGQPRSADPDAVRARMAALYAIDRDATVRASHQNPAVKRLYAEFLRQAAVAQEPRVAAHARTRPGTLYCELLI